MCVAGDVYEGDWAADTVKGDAVVKYSNGSTHMYNCITVCMCDIAVIVLVCLFVFIFFLQLVWHV